MEFHPAPKATGAASLRNNSITSFSSVFAPQAIPTTAHSPPGRFFPMGRARQEQPLPQTHSFPLLLPLFFFFLLLLLV